MHYNYIYIHKYKYIIRFNRILRWSPLTRRRSVSNIKRIVLYDLWRTLWNERFWSRDSHNFSIVLLKYFYASLSRIYRFMMNRILKISFLSFSIFFSFFFLLVWYIKNSVPIFLIVQLTRCQINFCNVISLLLLLLLILLVLSWLL